MASDDVGSDDVGSRPSRFMIIPNTTRHPNNTKTDLLPISEVITGLPRPYNNNTYSVVPNHSVLLHGTQQVGGPKRKENYARMLNFEFEI